jgi:hypothetical protein
LIRKPRRRGLPPPQRRGRGQRRGTQLTPRCQRAMTFSRASTKIKRRRMQSAATTTCSGARACASPSFDAALLRLHLSLLLCSVQGAHVLQRPGINRDSPCNADGPRSDESWDKKQKKERIKREREQVCSSPAQTHDDARQQACQKRADPLAVPRKLPRRQRQPKSSRSRRTASSFAQRGISTPTIFARK